MSVTVIPELVATASQDLGNLGEMLREANVTAAIPTTGIETAAADEVSAMISKLFEGHALSYQALAAQASQFHEEFVQTLAKASEAYQTTEAASTPALADPPIPTNVNPISLVMGGSGEPVWPQSFFNLIQTGYHLPNAYQLYTPEAMKPLFGSLTFDQSVAQGTQALNTAIQQQLALGHQVTVFGTSQSSTVATEEIRQLMASGSPGVNQLKFILTGDPNNPNGGLFERFNGGYIPGLDIRFDGATPPDSPYHTLIYTNQYDGISDFPQYPLNVVSDLNAVVGVFAGQHYYVTTAGAIELPTSPGYTGNTTYYMTLAQNLPLVTPLRAYLPAPYGNALADLLQPDLRVIVDMGYGSNEYANIPTPASLLEIPNPFTIVPDLLHGAVQGAQGFMADLGYGTAPTGYPATPVLNPDLNFDLPQSPVTGLSVLTSTEGWITQKLF